MGTKRVTDDLQRGLPLVNRRNLPPTRPQVCVWETQKVRKIRPSAEQAKLAALEAEVQTCQALCRVGLQALVALSQSAGRAAERALEREVEAATSPLAAKRLSVLREELGSDPVELKLAGAIERALIAAAEALETRNAA